jgi:hypothetical protein
MVGWFSQDTEEIAELLVITIVSFVGELKSKGLTSFRDGIERLEFVRGFSRKSQLGVDEYSFRFNNKLKDFFFHIEDDSLHIFGEDERYFGFKLYCDLLTGRVTVDTSDSALGKKATRKARQLCKMFARKYASATSGRIV